MINVVDEQRGGLRYFASLFEFESRAILAAAFLILSLVFYYFSASFSINLYLYATQSVPTYLALPRTRAIHK